MPLARDGKRADAQSRDTTFSGLPKASKVILNVNTQALTGGVWNNLFMETLRYNYGAHRLTSVAAPPYIYGQWTCDEPGVYEFGGGTISADAAAHLILGWNYNGTGLGAGALAELGTALFTANALGTRGMVWSKHQMNTNDTMQLLCYTNVNSVVFGSWMHVQKEGGQY